jgi:hypothetical protein
VLDCLPSDALSRLKFAVVAYAAFLGAQKALELQFADVAAAMFRTTR